MELQVGFCGITMIKLYKKQDLDLRADLTKSQRCLSTITKFSTFAQRLFSSWFASLWKIHCCTGTAYALFIVKRSVLLNLKHKRCSRTLDCHHWSPPPAASAASAAAAPPARPQQRWQTAVSCDQSQVQVAIWSWRTTPDKDLLLDLKRSCRASTGR